MVILHQSAGLANMLYEYFTAYALAKELGEELQIDITSTLRRRESYVLNLLELHNVKKIYRLPADPEHLSQGDPLSAASEFRENSITLVQPGVYNGEESDNVVFYHSLDEASAIRYKAGKKNLLLNGYFFDSKYYDKYWEELRDAVKLREETYFTKSFAEIIRGRESVGIHIRRGDFQVVDFAVPIEREYWQAAVMLMRELLNDPIFMVFSDDIDYAISVLGVDSHIYYVKFLGTQRADLEEFICLSRCDHRILTVHSTFGALADKLHGGNRITVFKGINPLNEPIEKHNREKNLQANGMRRILLYPDEITQKSSVYTVDNTHPPLREAKLNYNDSSINKELSGISLQAICGQTVNTTTRDAMLYKKMQADIETGNYEEVYENSQKIYVKYASDLDFQKMLRLSLRKLGYENEVDVEKARGFYECRHFIIAPYLDIAYSNYCVGLVELGNILFHMGHKVTYLFNTNDKGERWYIENNPCYVSRRGIKKGGEQYLISNLIKKYGSLTNFLNFMELKDNSNKILITRSFECLTDLKKANDIITIFPDFSDSRCIESIDGNKNINSSELTRMYKEADIIFSHTYRAENAYDWQDSGHLNYMDEIDRDGQVINIGCHFQPLYVGLALKIQEVLQKDNGGR